MVGVAGNARRSLKDPDTVEAYWPTEAADLPAMVVLVKTLGPPEGLARSAGTIARTIDSDIFPEIELLRNSFRRKLQDTEYSAITVALLGFIAHLLACLGIVGVVAYAVSQRTKEIGIRMALGAKPPHVLSVVLRQFSRPVFVGLLAGAGGAAGFCPRSCAGNSTASAISIPSLISTAIGIFVLTVVLAALLPARRALRVILCAPFVTIRIGRRLQSTTHTQFRQQALGSAKTIYRRLNWEPSGYMYGYTVNCHICALPHDPKKSRRRDNERLRYAQGG